MGPTFQKVVSKCSPFKEVGSQLCFIRCVGQVGLGAHDEDPSEWSPYFMYYVHNAQMRLYIGGLPYATTDAELREAFEKAGAVTNATVMRDKFTGRSRGFGFVEMSEEDGPKAIEMWNDKDFGGRTLQVNEARPMSEQRPPRHDFQRRDFHRREY